MAPVPAFQHSTQILSQISLQNDVDETVTDGPNYNQAYGNTIHNKHRSIWSPFQKNYNHKNHSGEIENNVRGGYQARNFVFTKDLRCVFPTAAVEIFFTFYSYKE